ncbi:MAG TPA: DinB family protein [Gemmatimonadales bacterium]|nr:DinB family protein [Gemmatimonadales bacterium]
MPLTPAQRSAMIDRYERGPDLLKAALATIPAEALQWRPGPGKWSAHEVIVHCADSETNAHGRIRYLLGEEQPVIQGYDQARWAEQLDYHQLPMAPALMTVVAVRANTVPLLRRATEADWAKSGVHTEAGRYGAEDWLQVYAEHLEKHTRQLERNLAAWRTR